MSVRILTGDCRALVETLPPESVQCVVTSPPYYGLRDYGVDGQIGGEPSPAAYVAQLVAVFRAARRVLRPDGTLWLNLGDSYAGSWGARGRATGTNAPRPDLEAKYGTEAPARHGFPALGIKPKDLMGVPWRVAFALQADGWYLRSDIIWSKPNPMPESVTDRPTKAHEYVFLFTQSERYFYDAASIREPHATPVEFRRTKQGTGSLRGQEATRPRGNLETCASPERRYYHAAGRNARSVWTVATQPYGGAHFATMPPMLVEPCVLAGSRPGDTVLDPFAGAGTVGLVAERLGRHSVLIELNPAYAALARERIVADAPLLTDVQEGA